MKYMRWSYADLLDAPRHVYDRVVELAQQEAKARAQAERQSSMRQRRAARRR